MTADLQMLLALSIEDDPFTAKNQAIRSYQSIYVAYRYASSALIQIESKIFRKETCFPPTKTFRKWVVGLSQKELN